MIETPATPVGKKI